MNTKTLLLLGIVGGIAYSAVDSGDAYAERRENTLRNDKAVRQRKLLVRNRLELAPLFESTINADFRHIIGGGAKLEYHVGDMLSFGVIGVYSTAINTKLVDRILPTLETTADPATREPSQQEFEQRLNSMPIHGAAYVSLTPWYGKLAAFGTAFVAFDFYFQAGVSFAQLKSDCDPSVCTDTNPAGGEDDPPDMNPNNDPPLNNGNRLGLYLGGGIHVFLNDFIALDLTVRDYAFTDNPSGADYYPDLMVGENESAGRSDNRFAHHLFFGAGLSIMFPTKVKRTP